MSLKIFLIATMITESCYSKTLECLQRNISCPDIKTADGFKFAYGFPGGREITEISIIDNKTVIAHAALSNQEFKHLSDVVSMDNVSIITRDCKDLRVQCILLDGPHVTECCVDFKTTEKMKTSDPKDSLRPWGLYIGVTVGVTVGVLCALCVLIVVLLWCWKKHVKHNTGSETQEVTAYALETQQNGEIGLREIPSDTDLHGSGENPLEKDFLRFESVHDQSNDATADGRTPQTLELDHNLNNVGIELSKNGDLSAPDVNRASNYRAMNRNVRDDPGGVNDTRGQFIAWSNERHGSQDHVNEGQLLYSSYQPAAVQRFDMTGEAVALVNKRGFDPDQVSRCSTVPDTDVESMTTNMKNHSIHR